MFEKEYGKVDLGDLLDDEVDPLVKEAMEEAMDHEMPNDPKALENLYRPAAVPHKVLPEREDE